MGKARDYIEICRHGVVRNGDDGDGGGGGGGGGADAGADEALSKNTSSFRFVYNAIRPPICEFLIPKQIATKDKISIRIGTCYIQLQ